MKQFIYKSDFNSGPEATKKQQMLFDADVEYAVSEGYELIQMKNGMVFVIVEDEGVITLSETEVTEEELQILAAEPDVVEFDPEDTGSFNQTFISQHTLTGRIEKDEPFFKDVESCFNANIPFIEDATGCGFEITSKTSVKGLYNTLQKDEDPIDEYCPACHNLMLIDDIINNTLTQKTAITPQQADTMLKLAKLKEMLGA